MNQFKVLIVDDDVITRKLLQLSLRKTEYEVVEASDAQAALKLLREDRFQIVISDWNMPGMSGVELCGEIRKRDSEHYTYTILLTSNTDESQRVIGLRSGADDFICKPFNPEELLERIGAAERILGLEVKEALIFALAKLAESRDTDTGLHLERVQRYTLLLAQDLRDYTAYQEQIDSSFISTIFQTSPLHDIGKVGIPDSVLLHPGKLSREQFEVMKTHTTIGAQCLAGAIEKSPSATFLRMAREIVLSHHEKFDGSGYPEGLIGPEIPLSARILAVADVYDALRSQRVYKPGFSHSKAKDIIVNDAGTHFDPVLVESFLRMETLFEAVAERFAEPSAEPTPAPETAVVH